MNKPEGFLKEKMQGNALLEFFISLELIKNDFIIGNFDKRLEIIINLYERLNLTIEHIKKLDETFEKYENNDGIKK